MVKDLKLLYIMIFALILTAGDINPPISIGSISFKDADWDANDNISYSRKMVSEITSENRAVIIHFSQLMFC